MSSFAVSANRYIPADLSLGTCGLSISVSESNQTLENCSSKSFLPLARRFRGTHAASCSVDVTSLWSNTQCDAKAERIGSGIVFRLLSLRP